MSRRGTSPYLIVLTGKVTFLTPNFFNLVEVLTEIYLGQGIPTLINQIKFLGPGLASFQLMAAPKFSIAVIYFLCVRFFKAFSRCSVSFDFNSSWWGRHWQQRF